ncbi:MAG: hypothetical protein ACI8P7_001578, partial [Candidatus Azotimanducaceae bacterium]
MLKYIKEVLANMPEDWLSTTTHRLDIYNEELAKTQFLEQFEILYKNNDSEPYSLNKLPTAYDYIRLGHPLSCVLEWTIAKQHQLKPEGVICFSSKTVPVLAILRKNLFSNKNTRIYYTGELPGCFDAKVLKDVYGYNFDLIQVESASTITSFDGSTVFISEQHKMGTIELNSSIDFYISTYNQVGSVLLVIGEKNESYISDIQHVRRRETIAMTPANCLTALKALTKSSDLTSVANSTTNKTSVLDSIKTITGSKTKALV